MKTMKKFVAALLVLTMVLGLTSIAFAKTEQKYEAGVFVQFKGSAYGYEKPGAKKSSVIVKKGSVAYVLDSKIKNGHEWIMVQVDYVKDTVLYFSVDYVKPAKAGTEYQQIVFAAGGSGRSWAMWDEDKAAEAKYDAKKAAHVKATGKVNIRQTPSLAGKSAGVLQKGKKLKWVGDAFKDSRGITFYAVKYTYKDQKICFVSSKYTKIVK